MRLAMSASDRIVGDRGAVLQRGLARGGAEIRHRNRLLEHRLRERQPHHADAAEADQQQVALPRPVDQPLQRAIGGDAGAHQGRRLIDRQRIVIQQIFGVGHQHVAGETAVDGNAEKALLGAEIFIAIEAVAALAAADPREHRYLFSDQALRNIRTCFLDHAGDLVSQRERQRHAARGVELLAAAEVGITVLDMQIGMAQPATLDADQHFASHAASAYRRWFRTAAHRI